MWYWLIDAIEGVLAFVGQFPDWDAAQLQQTYVAHRRITERRYTDAVNGTSQLN
jgi:hypothetical protein